MGKTRQRREAYYQLGREDARHGVKRTIGRYRPYYQKGYKEVLEECNRRRPRHASFTDEYDD